MNLTLKQIKQEVGIITELLNWSSQISGGGQNLKFSPLDPLRSAITKLEYLGLFTEQVSQLSKSFLFTTASNEYVINANEGTTVINLLNQVKVLVVNLYETLNKIAPDDNPFSINIKLPEISDFEDLANVARTLHTALTQVLYLPGIGGKVEIESVENGSIWFNILVGGAEPLGIIAALAWSAAVVYKKTLEAKAIEAHVRSLNLKNESLEDLVNTQKAHTALLIEQEALHIENQFLKEKVPENIERIKNSIKTLADLIERGAVIQPALMAPEDVKNLFPDVSNIIGIESKIKKLTS